jgi:hypothetical protein
MKIDKKLLSKELHFPIVQALISKKKKGLHRRIYDFFTFRRKWEVQKDYILWCEYLQKYIYIPAFFVFDGASVIKILYSIFSPTGILLLGSTPHDFGYRYKGLLVLSDDYDVVFHPYTKKELDKIFESFCVAENGLKHSACVATLTLSLFGFFGWKENRKLNKHIKTDFPDVFMQVIDENISPNINFIALEDV